MDEPAVLEFKETPLRGGEDEDGDAAVSKDEQLHIAIETPGPPLVIFAVHRLFTQPLRYRKASESDNARRLTRLRRDTTRRVREELATQIQPQTQPVPAPGEPPHPRVRKH